MGKITHTTIRPRKMCGSKYERPNSQMNIQYRRILSFACHESLHHHRWICLPGRRFSRIRTPPSLCFRYSLPGISPSLLSNWIITRTSFTSPYCKLLSKFLRLCSMPGCYRCTRCLIMHSSDGVPLSIQNHYSNHHYADRQALLTTFNMPSRLTMTNYCISDPFTSSASTYFMAATNEA